MKPIKGLVPFSVWLLAAMLIYFVIKTHYFALISFNFGSSYYFVVLALGLLSLLTAMGVMFKNEIMAVIGGIGVALAAISLIFINGFSMNVLQQEMVFVVLGVYFAARGKG